MADEYISKKEFIDFLNREIAVLSERMTEVPIPITLQSVINEVVKFPSADVAHVLHGKWVDMQVRRNHALICSVCRCDTGVIYEYKFCPHCGARMDGE